MAVFVDASALIALIAGESDADALADALDADPERLCSAVSAWETVAGLVRSYAFTVAGAREHVRLHLETASIRFVAIDEDVYERAVDAFARYGKGRHPASLNMGNCLAYACATAHGARRLFKGDDFARTDIAHGTGA